ncbi:ROK family protein [Rugosimonospora acidiphila]|uniref:ROK family protein n=1 Tax=Rugosimonospora acidiphila TaxID=556531 RepID=A0ABP9SC76_9ACTN
MTALPVLEIGGSHVTAALVDMADGTVAHRGRGGLRATDPVGMLLRDIAETACRLDAPAGATWGVAVPGPFDYDTGIGRFHGVGKFASLNGVDVGAELRARIRPHPHALRFLNDAAAFGCGEWQWGAAKGHDRAVAITLGTGVGSAFLDRGRIVADGPRVPPEGRADLLTINGQPLEQTVSTRAVLAAYRRAGGEACDGVAEVMARVAHGDERAAGVVDEAYRLLGRALAPWLRRFEASVLVIGGGISAAWQFVAPPLGQGIQSADAEVAERVTVVRSPDAETSALRGAALRASALAQR